MTVAETLLVFVGAPLAVVVVLALLIFVPAGRTRRARYKPGQPWEHEPLWYEPHPDHGPAAGHGETLAIGSSVYGEPQSQDGRPHGAAVSGITSGSTAPHAHPPVAAGPLGGARGTW